MIDVILQMAALIICGVVWQLVKPGGLSADLTRKVLTSVVYYLLLPALVLAVMWQAPLGGATTAIVLVAAAGVFAGILTGALLCRFCQQGRAQTGAMILAMAFPNVTYLGLPVLEATFGSWSRSVAIQTDILATTPLLFTVGIMLASRLGQSAGPALNLSRELIHIPAMWAALIAIGLNLLQLPMPRVLAGLLDLLGRGVVPLMLFSLGLSLQWRTDSWRKLPAVGIVAGVRLILIPLLAWPLSALLGLSGELRAAVVMEAAMPSMVIGIVLCDRFGLDVNLYATAVTVTTALSIVTLPLWHGVLISI